MFLYTACSPLYTVACEIELIDVTAKALKAIGLTNFRVRINDRNVLKSLLLNFGFLKSQLDSVCTSLDKVSKIGIDGVGKELCSKNCDSDAIKRLVSLFADKMPSIEEVHRLLPDNTHLESLVNIIDGVKQISHNGYEIDFDISLVRGQGYYTGTIFEIESTEFKDSIAGGGRYDNLIGKFINENIPAVGFSIGFERIYCILAEKNYSAPDAKKRIAILYDDFISAYERANLYHADYDVTLFEKPHKLGKFLNRLQIDGYYGYIILDEKSDIILLQ